MNDGSSSQSWDCPACGGFWSSCSCSDLNPSVPYLHPLLSVTPLSAPVNHNYDSAIPQHQTSTNNPGNASGQQFGSFSDNQDSRPLNVGGSTTNASYPHPISTTESPNTASSQNITAPHDGETATNEEGKRSSVKCWACTHDNKPCVKLNGQHGDRCVKCINRTLGEGKSKLAELDAEQLNEVRCMSVVEKFDDRVVPPPVNASSTENWAIHITAPGGSTTLDLSHSQHNDLNEITDSFMMEYICSEVKRPSSYMNGSLNTAWGKTILISAYCAVLYDLSNSTLVGKLRLFSWQYFEQRKEDVGTFVQFLARRLRDICSEADGALRDLLMANAPTGAAKKAAKKADSKTRDFVAMCSYRIGISCKRLQNPTWHLGLDQSPLKKKCQAISEQSKKIECYFFDLSQTLGPIVHAARLDSVVSLNVRELRGEVSLKHVVDAGAAGFDMSPDYQQFNLKTSMEKENLGGMSPESQAYLNGNLEVDDLNHIKRGQTQIRTDDLTTERSFADSGMFSGQPSDNDEAKSLQPTTVTTIPECASDRRSVESRHNGASLQDEHPEELRQQDPASTIDNTVQLAGSGFFLPQPQSSAKTSSIDKATPRSGNRQNHAEVSSPPLLAAVTAPTMEGFTPRQPCDSVCNSMKEVAHPDERQSAHEINLPNATPAHGSSTEKDISSSKRVRSDNSTSSNGTTVTVSPSGFLGALRRRGRRNPKKKSRTDSSPESDTLEPESQSSSSSDGSPSIRPDRSDVGGRTQTKPGKLKSIWTQLAGRTLKGFQPP